MNVSNVDTLNKANDRLNAGGKSETERFDKIEPGEADEVDVAEGFILLKRYQDKGDFEAALQIVTQLRRIGTKAGQTVQAFSILGRITPEGMTLYAQKELDAARDERTWCSSI